MGFHLWVDKEIAWAQGAYEYRPMGVAVISSSDLFRQRDFKLWQRPPDRERAVYLGQFASIGHINAGLRQARLREARSPARDSEVAAGTNATRGRR